MDQQNISLRDDKVYSSTGHILYNKYPSRPISWRTRDMNLYENGVSNVPKRLKVRDI